MTGWIAWQRSRLLRSSAAIEFLRINAEASEVAHALQVEFEWYRGACLDDKAEEVRQQHAKLREAVRRTVDYLHSSQFASEFRIVWTEWVRRCAPLATAIAQEGRRAGR